MALKSFLMALEKHDGWLFAFNDCFLEIGLYCEMYHIRCVCVDSSTWLETMKTFLIGLLNCNLSQWTLSVIRTIKLPKYFLLIRSHAI